MKPQTLVRPLLTNKIVRPILRRFLLPRSIYQHLHFRDEIAVHIDRNGSSFRMIAEGHQVENDLYWTAFGSGWEGLELKVWIGFARTSAVVADIGANSGVYALAAAAANPTAKVFAFEPMSSVAKRLRRNVALNPFDITVVEAALTSRDGPLSFFEPPTDYAYSATLDPEMARSVGATVTRKVDGLRFDTFLTSQGLSRVDLVKVDVERHEAEVFRGFGDILMQARPVVVAEVLDREVGETLAPIFAKAEYTFFPLAPGATERSTPLGQGPKNYLFVPAERRLEGEMALKRAAE